jgi:hypothetical protein
LLSRKFNAFCIVANHLNRKNKGVGEEVGANRHSMQNLAPASMESKWSTFGFCLVPPSNISIEMNFRSL